MSFLLDTNIVSEARKGVRADAGVRRWLSSVDVEDLYISVLVLGEIRLGIELLRGRDPTQAGRLDSWLDELRSHYLERALPITAEVAEMWGRINAPNPLPTGDSLMAATAIVRDMTLVTRNTSDVEHTGARLLNPFSINT